MEKFAECVQDSEQLKSALLEMQVQIDKRFNIECKRGQMQERTPVALDRINFDQF